jgi:L-malate glycosyltransferase
LRVLFLPAWYPSERNAVAGIFVKEHAKAASLYNEVIVLYVESCDKNIKGFWRKISDCVEDGVRTIRIMYKKSPIPKTTYFIYLWSIKKAFKQLLKEGWKPDIIHAHVYLAGVPAVILGKKHKIPVIITEHCTCFTRHKLGRLDILKAKFAMNRSSMILTVSDDLKKHIKSYGICNRFQVVPNVVNTELFHPVLNIDKRSTKRMLLVALLTPKKGVSYLLKALGELKDKRNDFVLGIIGDGPNRKEYEEMAEDLGLSGIVEFYGIRTKEEIAEFMRNCDFFVLPSLYETFGVVYIEAMASGLPVISSKVGGVPEIVNKDVGILVPPRDTDALVKAIDFMLDHYRDYSSEKISQYARDNFSYETVASMLLKIYQEITNTI